jgi:hypothetical protein
MILAFVPDARVDCLPALTTGTIAARCDPQVVVVNRRRR